MDHSKKRIGLFLSSTVIFIIGFIVNITSDSSLYNVDLNIVPGWQSDAALGSKAFIGFMNVISNIFNPVVCAGYIALFWLISCKKLEVMVFLVWFIFLSWVLAVLKMAIQQSRPYWMQGSGVQMLEWTCYSQFGCPSGHAMLGLILMEFIIRFFMRSYKTARRLSWLLYIILVILQLLVMFSRVILGMHTFNEVLMGAMIGLYSISAYYLYMEALIIKYFDHLIHTSNKRYQFLIVLTAIFGTFLIDILVAYVPKYNFQDTFDYIVTISGCEKIKEYKSFQYKCFEDSSILMASFGLIVGLTYMKNPENLTKPLAYTRCSGKFAGKLGIMILLAAVPAVIFLNPFWGDIPAANPYLALIIWICQCFGFFLAVLMLLLVSPIVCFRLGLQEYTTSEYVELSRAIAANTEQMELSSNKECL